MALSDWLGVFGIILTVVVLWLQYKIDNRIKEVELRVRSEKWEIARNVFYLNCFIASGDLLRAILSYTAKSDGRVYICDDMEHPLHEIVHRTSGVYNQYRTLSPALGDSPSASLSGHLNILQFSANAADGALRCWDEIENSLPVHRVVESNHEDFVIFVGPNRRINPRLKSELRGKNFLGFAVNLYECCVRLQVACEALYRTSMEQSGDGRELEFLFPPAWVTNGSSELPETFVSFKERLDANLSALAERIQCMKDSGICLVKYPVDRAHI